MSLTLEEREQWIREIQRLNNSGWAEAKKRRVHAIQAANPGMSFETAWSKAEREQLVPEPTTIGGWANLVKAQNPMWTFEKSWSHAEAIHPELVTGSTAQPLMRDSRLEEEMNKHLKLEETKKSANMDAQIVRMSKIRKLMAEKSWTFDEAFTEICRQEKEQKASARYAVPIGGTFLVTAQSAIQFDGLPSVIQYMPAGRSTITPSVDGKPKQITIDVGPTTARALQADLAKLLSENVRPYVDFDHAGGAAAALPKRFYWTDEGVMLELDWTGAGKTAIGGRDYSYLSPTFLISKDSGAISLPPSGAIASLVNNPAFRTIRRISATA